jgi:signal transduction histidine kinase
MLHSELKRRVQLPILSIIPIILVTVTFLYWKEYRTSVEGGYSLLYSIHNLKLIDNSIDSSLLSNGQYTDSDRVSIQLGYFEKEFKKLTQSRFLTDNFKKKRLDTKFNEIWSEFFSKEKRVKLFLEKHKLWLISVRKLINMHSDDDIHDNIKKLPDFDHSFNRFVSTLSLKARWSELYSEEIEELLKSLDHRKSGNKTLNQIYSEAESVYNLSKEIGDILSEVSKKALFEKMFLLENYLIREFNKKESRREVTFNILATVSTLFFLILIILLIREKRLQEKLNTINRSLEDRIRDEVEKSREKDRVVFQQLKVASMSEMIGNIAHQWRQPINTLGIVIQDYENAYEFDELDGDYLQHNRQEAMKQIDYMSNMIDNFSNFFQQNEEQKQFSVNMVVEKVIAIIGASIADEQQIEIKTDFSGEIELFGIEEQYMQVLTNLINNSIDAIHHQAVNKPLISIRLYENKRSILLSVFDNGGGIPEEIAEKVFEPYFTTKHQSLGTGIGLYMSKLIIEDSFNGTLTFKSNEDSVMFTIAVPKEREE